MRFRRGVPDFSLSALPPADVPFGSVDHHRREVFAQQGRGAVERVELLPYHTLGVHKYEAMGLEYKLRDVRENTPEQLDRATALLREYFPTVVVN